MKKINIYLIVLMLLIGFSWGETSSAWSFGKKATKDIKTIENQENDNLPSTSEEVNVFSSKDNDFNVFNDDKSSLNDKLQEATIEKNAIVDPDDTFSKNMDLISDTVDVYTQSGQYVAKGNAVLVVPNEQLQMYANEIIVDNNNYEIIGIGNVKIVKNGSEYFGDYIRLATKKESSFFENPILYYTNMTISSKNATMHTDETIAKDGAALIKDKKMMIYSSSQYGGLQASRLFDMQKVFDSSKNNYKVSAKKIYVKRTEDRTDITLKQAHIYRGKHRVGYTPIMQLSTDKDVSYNETLLPELGNHPNIGMYIAPSVLLPMPKGSTLKLGPLVSLNKSDLGLGVFARLSTPKSISQLLYSSNKDKFVIGAEYRFTNDLKLKFALNEYLDNGWMGGQMPHYGVELDYEKLTQINQANAYARNRLTAGFYRDNEDYDPDPTSAMRFKWQMSLYNQKPILNWERYLMLGYAYDHDFRLYHTGDTMGVIRVGPRLYTDLGRLYLELIYYAAGEYGDSPFMFDRYRYGQGSVCLKGQYYINKYLSVGYFGMYNVMEPDWEGNRLTENQFIISAGTEDMKVRFGWDTIRSTCTLGLDLLLGSGKTYMEFDEMQVDKLNPKENKGNAKAERKEKKKKSRL